MQASRDLVVGHARGDVGEDVEARVLPAQTCGSS
jgi:hypothetical protein